MVPPDGDVVEKLCRAGVGRGDLVAVALAPSVGLGLVLPASGLALAVDAADPSAVVGAVEEAFRPRWVTWSGATAATLVGSGIRIATSWDIAAAHRLLHGGWDADPARVWAVLHELRPESIPADLPQDLFGQAGAGDDPEDPVRPDGYLRPDWAAGGWSRTPARLCRWAELASAVAELQMARLADLRDRPSATSTARSESAAELLCAEMSFDGLPMDRAVAEAIVARFVGPRPEDDREAAARRAERDAEVLRHAAAGPAVDLRSPAQVKSLLRRSGIDLPDTRAWRLKTLAGTHPVVDALLEWRKAERVATTYGYAWLDEHLGNDGRLRGSWTACDGAAGRMTASAGLHNMPAELRPAVIAEERHVFVRADLGQIEPRVLAAVSRDRLLARATLEPDMYAPVAQQLGVDRATAKVAVLGAMYGQTTGHGAQALRGLKVAYPVAMGYLEDAEQAARSGRDLRTYGGRLVPMGAAGSGEVRPREPLAQVGARGRYGRNAVVQGAAAELFKVWAATVRARAGHLDAHIVLCLHDELLVHAPAARGDLVVGLVADCLEEAARRWAPDDSVRFVADLSVISCWADAKS